MPLPGHFSFGRVPEGKVWGSPCFILGVRLRLKVGPGPAQEVVCAAPTDLEIKNRWPSGLTSRVRSSCRNPALWKAGKLAPITPGKIGRAQEYYCLP